MLAPQSDEDLRPFVQALQREDPDLDIRWEPKAVRVKAAVLGATGVLTEEAEYRGLWEVIRYETANLHPDRLHNRRQYAVLCRVSGYVRKDGLLYITVDGAYEPIDDRLLEIVLGSKFAQVRAKVNRHQDESEARRLSIDEDPTREALERTYFKVNHRGGVGEYAGKGADFAAMEQNALARSVLLRAN